MIYLEEAKNGSLTCRKAGHYLHSKYNPEEEADKFVRSLSPDFSPFCIIVAGPCLSYCFAPLRKRFPAIPIYAVQYETFFTKKTEQSAPLHSACAESTAPAWDSVFCTEHKDALLLAEELFEQLGEQLIFGAFFTVWPPAERLYTEQSRLFWKAVKLLLQKSRDVLATRAFFSRCWLKNTFRFFIRCTHICGIEKGHKPILVAASGPSLEASIPYIKKYRKSFFLIGLSSALQALIENGIYPDLCISTDGGFYAEAHLRILEKVFAQGVPLPLAVSAESRVSSAILENLPIIPLRYGDGIENRLFEHCRLPAVPALRNGSVSGTAASLALSLTSVAVYFCGLDLENGSGYRHAQPNMLEKNDTLTDNRLRPLATRLSVPENGSLNIYRQWFSSRNEEFSKRTARVSAVPYKQKLGNIRDLHWDDIKENLRMYESLQMPRIYTIKNGKAAENKKNICDFLYAEKAACEHKNEPERTVQWYENCAPLAYLSSLKYPESEEFKAEAEKTVLHTFEELFKLCT
ncbi:MAG: 6-hydroxymethylpterin diphosphokinase MptE-like protein [Treponema sp.]|uniref:6-hydroxymethylpterin diphosphokinase MptE-like protein n=1 Tax=Treponema sp. TaxID=166 RepID=UPI003FA2E752